MGFERQIFGIVWLCEPYKKIRCGGLYSIYWRGSGIVYLCQDKGIKWIRNKDDEDHQKTAKPCQTIFNKIFAE